MSRLRGALEYAKWEAGERLTLRQAHLAHCYECNGLDEGGKDCKGRSCPMYQFMPYNPKRNRSGRAMTPEQRDAARERLQKCRNTRK